MEEVVSGKRGGRRLMEPDSGGVTMPERIAFDGPGFLRSGAARGILTSGGGASGTADREPTGREVRMQLRNLPVLYKRLQVDL